MNATPSDAGPEDPVVGGVVVRLSQDPHLQSLALATLRKHPAITLGVMDGPWLTLAVEARNAADGRDLHAWMATLPGVDWLEIAAVFFEGDAPPLPPLAPVSTSLHPQETLA